MIPRVAAQAILRAQGVDCVTALTASQAASLRASGAAFVCRYLGALTSAEVDGILSAGLALFPVTYANRFSGAEAVAELAALGIPVGTTVWLDAESVKLSDAQTMLAISDWAGVLRSDGFDPGLYVGPGLPLTADQLGVLPVDRYWESMSVVPCPVDRGQAVGFCLRQLYPSGWQAGVWTDGDVVQQDYRGRAPLWCVRGAARIDREEETDPEFDGAA